MSAEVSGMKGWSSQATALLPGGSPCDKVDQAIADFQEGKRRESSFQIIVDCFYPRVLRFLSRFARSPEDRSDIAQETFLQVYRNLAKFRGDAKFSTWLFRIACNNARRIQDQFSFLSLDDLEFGKGVGWPEMLSVEIGMPQLEALLKGERGRLLHEAVQILPTQQRRCMELRLYQDRSYQEIASLLQISLDAVKVNLYSARERLKTLLADADSRVRQ